MPIGDAADEADHDQHAEDGQDGAEQLADREVALAVLEVLHAAHDDALVDEHRYKEEARR